MRTLILIAALLAVAGGTSFSADNLIAPDNHSVMLGHSDKSHAGFVSNAVPAIPASERQALIDLYNSTNGPAWLHNAGWLGPVGTECTWFAVSCDATGTTVKEINACCPGNNLSGSLPASLGNLSNLTTLRLEYNHLSGNIPTDLGKLTNLTHLYLAGNQLSGSIPTQLGSLTNLTYLQLSDNQLSGSIPTQLADLTNLVDLELRSNQLSGSIPPQLARLTKLQILYLSFNQFNGNIPRGFGSLINLEQLFLGSSQLSGTIPPELGNLTKLKTLFLIDSQVSGSIPAELGSLTNLTYLNLFGNELAGPIPTELGNLPNLTYLNLAGNQLNGSIPTQLRSLANLQELFLTSNQLSGTIPPQLGSLSNLTNLSLGGNHLSGNIPTELANLTRLQQLNLDRNRLSGSIPTELGNLTRLRLLYFFIDWDALHTTDPTLTAFLNAVDSGWQGTQTIAPQNVSTSSPTATSLNLTWTPIAYVGDAGFYQVLYSTVAGGPYTPFPATTAGKAATTFTLTGLSANTTYYFVVQTTTNPNAHNTNTVTSEFSAEASGRTALPPPPLATYTFVPVSPAAGQEVAFTDTSTGPPTSWSWSFGDGATSTIQNPIHAYGSDGTFSVSLSVSNSSGSSAVTQTVQVRCNGCVSIHGHVMAGSRITIRGNGTDRIAKLLPATANETNYVTTVASDGSYAFTASPGVYQVQAIVPYSDSEYFDSLVVAGAATKTYTAIKTLPASSYNAPSTTIDIVFPQPIVLIHGIMDTPAVWKDWMEWAHGDSSGHGSNRPDLIVFTPGYPWFATYEEEASFLNDELTSDFSLFAGTPGYSLIASEKGGLVTRMFYSVYSASGLGRALDDVIMLGTPNSGSDLYIGTVANQGMLDTCSVRQLNLDSRFRALTTDLSGHVHVIAGTKDAGETLGSGAAAAATVNDGVVAADSVFGIEQGDAADVPKEIIPGIIVPLSHSELVTDTSMLEIALSYYESGQFAGPCPSTIDFATAACGTSFLTLLPPCWTGRGYSLSGGCSIPGSGLPEPGRRVVPELTWQPPDSGTLDAPPTGLRAQATFAAGCVSPGNATHASSLVAPDLLGYQIYRSNDPSSLTENGTRLAFVPAATLQFIDESGTSGGSWYTVTAVYADGESVPAPRVQSTVSSRRRAVSH